MIYTTNPSRLINVVRILLVNRNLIDNYFNSFIFFPYKINIRRCIPELRIEDAKRLLDFSFTTRQGGQDKKSLQDYINASQNVYKTLEKLLNLLKSDLDAKTKNTCSLLLLHTLENSGDSLLKGIGQKIATMFLKFIVYYSDDFQGRAELLRELFIPFDVHTLRLIFRGLNGRNNNQLNLYDSNITQSQLKYDFTKIDNEIVFKRNTLLKIQYNIRNDFDELNIEEPPILMDYLWYVGTFYCSSGLEDIGCKICFLNTECDNFRNL